MYKYQQIVNEGAILSDDRCLDVDPVVAQKRVAAFQYWQDYQASKSADVIVGDIAQVVTLSSQVLEKSAPWMERMQNFVNRLDFRYFSSKESRELTFAQFEKYNTDYEANKALVEYYTNPTNEGGKKLVDSVEKMKKAQGKVEEKFKAVQGKSDIRLFFVKIPMSKCAQEPEPGIEVMPEFQGVHMT